MANFSVQVRKIIKKANHPNADRLTIYNVGGYNCISNKVENENGEYIDRYNIGDLVVYIPTESIVPKWLLKKMDLWNDETNCGMLCGSEGNRVKSVKLRGIPSEGLLYPVRNEKDETFIETKDFFKLVREGDNVGEILEIEKYIPPIPASMGGEIFHSRENIAEHYDVEPIQLYEHLLIDGEPIEIQEKIHGTNTRWCFSKLVTDPETFGENNDVFICSKGNGDKGLFLKNVPSNENAYYVKCFLQSEVEKKVKSSKYYAENDEVIIFSESYGMQDMKYGLKNGQVDYAVFDVYIGRPGYGRYLNYEEMHKFCDEIGLKSVPIFYRGPYSKEVVDKFTDGLTTVGTDRNQIREGVVVKPLNERWDVKIGRVMVKSVSMKYKLRKNGTEFN